MSAEAICEAVEDRLRQQHQGHPTIYRREFGICVGAGRVDVAAVNGAITACEVKSVADGLSRLPGQAERYGQVADYAILAVERRHPERVAALVPDWWGVWHAVRQEGTVTLKVLRHPMPNPSVNPLAVAQLLWRAEALEVLQRRRLQKGLLTATRWRLWERLAEELPLQELREEVRVALKARREW